MEVERAQFLIMVGEIGRQARLAGTSIEIVTRDDRSVYGIPHPREAGDAGLGHTGLDPEFGVGDAALSLDDVVEVRVCSPCTLGEPLTLEERFGIQYRRGGGNPA